MKVLTILLFGLAATFTVITGMTNDTEKTEGSGVPRQAPRMF